MFKRICKDITHMTNTTLQVVKSMTTMVHALHVRNEKANGVLVKEKECLLLEDGSVQYNDKVRIYRDPVRPYWLTKPGLRTHPYKKEFEYIENLDRYNVHDSNLMDSIKENLKIYKRCSFRELCNSPYIYGADIETAVFLKAKYLKNIDPDIPIKYTIGALDIENEMHNDERIIAITYIHEHEIYTAVLRDYMLIKDDDTSEFRIATEQDIYITANELIGSLLKEHNFTLKVYIANDEIELIKWIFCNIHRCKTDFIGVWNIRHDIPHILKRLEALNVDPKSILCHPSIPEIYHHVEYHMDNSKNLQHFTDRWDWFECSGFSQFIDAMCLYSRIRKTSGRKPSYALDAIANLELGTGKLKLNNATNDHTYEQRNNFVPYVVYNINDVLIMQLMEFKNNDYRQLMSLTGVSMLKDFNKQTIMGKNNTFFYGYERGKIIASTGSNMLTEFDELMPKFGGAVLNPNRTLEIGVNIIEEAPDIETRVCIGVNDLDVAAEYPSILASFNISKETKLSTVVAIHGYPSTSIEQCFANCVSPIENAVWMANVFFGLPNYTEMDEMIYEYFNERMHQMLPYELDIKDPQNVTLINQLIQKSLEKSQRK